jgi:cytidylate kinase
MSLITITRSIGCEGALIARRVSDELKLDLYDDQRIQEEAIKMGIPEDLKSLDEKAPGLFDRLLTHKPSLYLDLMESVVYKVSQQGQGVILDHGAHRLLQDFGCALHVRINASEAFRIQHLMDHQAIDQEAAEKIIHKNDRERRNFLQFAFHIEWNDSSLYDLIIKRDKLSADSAAKLIVEVAQSQEIKECSLAALESMERLSLSKKVEAAIIKNNFSPVDFQVDITEEGVAKITGWTHTKHEKDRLLKVVEGVPGVSEVKSNVFVVKTFSE